ncbi:MAG: response regulator transcription factor [Nitriliruptor sp.]|uniref:response regulator n=1 Tax=Nitriliruptor sp. TaxID=2448056 RepID=UPI0034A04C4D
MSEQGPVDVIVVEDHELLAQSVTYALRAQGLQVATSGDVALDAVAALVQARQPRLVLLDLDLGEHGTSLPLIGRCVDAGARVLMLTAVKDRARLAACIEAGAVGVVSKSQPLEDLVTAITEVMERGTSLSDTERQSWLADLRQHRSQEVERFEPFERLTERERQVLDALIDGWSADDLAAEWVVAVSTVRSQIRSILLKLGVNSQLSAIALSPGEDDHHQHEDGGDGEDEHDRVLERARALVVTPAVGLEAHSDPCPGRGVPLRTVGP